MKTLTAMMFAMVLAASAAGAAEVLPFIEDDFAKAASLARSRNVPLFIEAWAPW